MSGIYGIFHKTDQPVTTETLAPLASSMSFWGPDGHGQWCAGSVGLGQLMLHITPESLGEQLPAHHPTCPDLVITADARLDNRHELCAALAVPRGEQLTIPDSTLILLAYEKWGTACVEKLRGDFSFAIWDGRTRQLFCGRDLFGCKPLLYYDDGARFIFASDIKAVLAHAQVPKGVNEALLAAFLQQKTVFAQKRHTFFADIVKLPPAHHLTVTSTSTQLVRYWSPENAVEVRLAAAEDYAEQLAELLQQAVACRLRSAFPVGAHLSGGIDSSAVTVLAARTLRQRNQPLTAFSWSPPPASEQLVAGDERTRIADICQREQIVCHYLSTTWQEALVAYQRDVATEPAEMIWREEQVQQQAAANHIRVLLSGWGGDELVSINGHGVLPELLRRGEWGKFARLFKQSVVMNTNHGDAPAGLTPLRWIKQAGATFYRKVWLPSMVDYGWPSPTRRDPYGRFPRTFIQPGFAQRQQDAVVALRQPAWCEGVALRARQLRLLEYGHLTWRMEEWTTSGAQQRLVYAYPLLDRRVVEFCLGVPAEQFYWQGRSRSLFRRATAGLLPVAFQQINAKLEPGAIKVVQEMLQNALISWCDQLLANAQHAPVASYINLTALKEVRPRLKQFKSTEWTSVHHALACFYIRHLATPS